MATRGSYIACILFACIHCTNGFMHVVWYRWQLEHHIFPTMPRYKYPAVSKLLKAWAAKHNLDYRLTGEFQIIADNVKLLEKLSIAEPMPGNPDSTPLFKQV